MLVLRTPKQNDIAERRNKLVIEAKRAMLIENDASKMFWRDTVNTTPDTMKRVQVRKTQTKPLMNCGLVTHL